MSGWFWPRRRRRRGRPLKPRFISFSPLSITFIPYNSKGDPIQGQPVFIAPDEFEAFRLVYLEDLTQEEAALKMKVSRGTLWRLLSDARKKIALAIVEKRPLVIGF